MRKVPRFTLKQHDPSLFRGTYKTCICAMNIRMSNIWGPNAYPPLFEPRYLHTGPQMRGIQGRHAARRPGNERCATTTQRPSVRSY